MVSGPSNSVVLAALLAGCGGAALIVPGVQAGQRIEFSAPAIPLSIPKVDNEPKEPDRDRMSIPSGLGAGNMGVAGMDMPRPMTIVIMPSKAKAKEGWESGTSGDQGRNDPNAELWRSISTDGGLLTNDLGLRQEWDSSSGDRRSQRKGAFGTDNLRDTRQFGMQGESDRNGVRGENGLGRGHSDDGDNSFWSKALNRHDPSVLGRLMDGGFVPFAGGTSGAATGFSRAAASVFNAASTASPLVPPEYGISSFADDTLRRQSGETAGAAPEQMRAWEVQSAARQQSRSGSGREVPGPVRVLAPNRPVNLPMPKRPGDPF
jgi:hypothetical protein